LRDPGIADATTVLIWNSKSETTPEKKGKRVSDGDYGGWHETSVTRGLFGPEYGEYEQN
jgi:hypothetical protein